MEIQEKIIHESGDLFMRYGIKSLTMDDLAKNLAISKKTIYKHFKNKNDLIEQIIRSYTDGDKCNIKNINKESENAIDEIVRVSKYIKVELSKMTSNAIYDLQKFYPTMWKFFQEHKNESLYNTIFDNIEWGKKEGYYRKDVNSEILSILRVEQIEMGLNPEIFSSNKYSILEIQMELLKHFIIGITTPKGLDLYNKYISENE